MIPTNFPESNCVFGPPVDMDESQVMPIRAFLGEHSSGSLDGSQFVVVAWQPSPQDRERIANGGQVFLSMIGGLAPHIIGTSFLEVSNLS